jgi:transposase
MDAVRKHVLAGRKLHADDTPIPVLAPGNGRTKTGRLWTLRKFHEIHVIHASTTTTEALARIGALYAIEEEIRGKPADLRLSIRQTRARPLLDEPHNWMENTLRGLSPKSETAAAIRYALSRWRALKRYTEDGLLEIDNSAAERALRDVALGRKNFLFADSDCGGERAAAMYALIGSAKLNGLDPELYLRTVLATIADHPVSHVDELLPWNLAPVLQSHSSEAA